jgi:hypothetical protein
MTVQAQVEYLDFAANTVTREYRLRVRQGTEVHDFVVAIPNQAFLDGRVRYQDAPDVCYLKLQREIAAGDEGALPARALEVTDGELEEYRIAHTPKSPRKF